MSIPIRGHSIASLAPGLQSGAIDPVMLAEETFAAIRAHDDPAIFVSLTEERAYVEARAAAARLKAGRSLGLLDGIPIAWKDLFDIEGTVTTAGSVVLSDNAPARADAAVVAALKAAGMIAIGRLNMSEFAFSGLGINPHYGTPKNPNSTDGHRLPGGSSSGSGVAVAAGLVPVSIGSDTGGSIRIPAAFNGIVGYKATRGRYSMEGVYPLATSLDSLGPLCRTVQDAVWVDAAMRGFTAPQVRRAAISDLRFVIPETIFFDDAGPEVIASFEAVVARLVKAGARVRRQAFPQFDELFAMMAKRGALVTAEAYALHEERLKGEASRRMDHRVVARARLGEKISMVDYVTTLATRRRMISRMEQEIASDELLLSPTVPHVAPHVAPLLESDDAFFAMNAKTLRNTLIGNFLDWCGVSLPIGPGIAGMPIGLLLSGLPNRDEPVLGASLAVEQLLGS
ncbi:amidase [Phyllobacterium salinisoli]|uniref:Indoleacetamide hydrolase n=1 Tax=Phyllobacterium salinisoli TaxID=1899321 RepID=A0A368JXZ8_9HYPH|nr:amidase [Phyllobacterium salinisoli]RCS21774.1 amidase [Phyllobacterium salinisoli]